jgi:hypothetical protein
VIRQTTGRMVSRLAVLTVLTHNCIDENWLDEDERGRRCAELELIINGRAGVRSAKLARRCLDRCEVAGWN